MITIETSGDCPPPKETTPLAELFNRRAITTTTTSAASSRLSLNQRRLRMKSIITARRQGGKWQRSIRAPFCCPWPTHSPFRCDRSGSRNSSARRLEKEHKAQIEGNSIVIRNQGNRPVGAEALEDRSQKRPKRQREVAVAPGIPERLGLPNIQSLVEASRVVHTFTSRTGLLVANWMAQNQQLTEAGFRPLADHLNFLLNRGRTPPKSRGDPNPSGNFE